MPIQTIYNPICPRLLKLLLPVYLPTHGACTHLHLLPSLLLFSRQDQPCHHCGPNKLHYRPAGNPPYLYTHTAPRRPWECKQPLHIARHPTPWYPEERSFGEPELQEKAEAIGADPAKSSDGAVESRLEGFEVVCCGGVSISPGSLTVALQTLPPILLGRLLFFSYCSITLSWFLRSFAHLANSS